MCKPEKTLSRHVSVLQTSGRRGQGLTSRSGQSERSRLLFKASWAADIKPPRRADAILFWKILNEASVTENIKKAAHVAQKNTFSVKSLNLILVNR